MCIQTDMSVGICMCMRMCVCVFAVVVVVVMVGDDKCDDDLQLYEYSNS